MSRSLRTFFLVTRPIYRSAVIHRSVLRFRRSYVSHEGQKQVQTVRFQDPRSPSRRAAQVLVRASLILLLAWYISDHVLEDDKEEAKSGVKSPSRALQNIDKDNLSNPDEEEEEEEEAEMQLPENMPEDAVFIPLWFPKQKPPYSYTASDPEWQSYATVAKDQEKREKLLQTIVGVLIREISRDRDLSQWLGQPVRPRRVWLEFDYPTEAPKEYERPGIEITDDYVALTRRPVSEKQYQRIQHALWPKSIATSLYVSYRTFWSLQYAKLKQYLNIRSEAGNEASQLNPGPIDLPQLSRAGQKENSRINAGLDQMANPNAADSKSTDASNTKSPAKPPPATVADRSRILGSLPSVPRLTGDAATAMTAFKQTLAKTWRPPLSLERGQMPISGLIEIEGSQGVRVYEVVAFYDCKKSALVSISAQTRRSKLKKPAH
ncbi:MAG: hypothetical protein Q9217_004351 [Psora testacea]